MPIYTQKYTDDIPSQQQQQRERSNSISPTTSMADLCLYSELKHSTNEQSEPLKNPSTEIQPTHHKKVASLDSLAYTLSGKSEFVSFVVCYGVFNMKTRSFEYFI